MSPKPVVTIVIPAYEAGAEIRPTVDSALAQTFTDFEILIIDDGSTEKPVPTDLPNDDRITIDRRPTNGGYARVTNYANSRARGEWVMYLDADDTIEPRYLEVMLAAGEKYNADTVFAPLMCVRDGTELGTLLWRSPGALSDSSEAMRFLLRNRVSGSQHLLLRRPRPNAPEGQTYSDWVFLLRHLTHTTSVAWVEDALYRYAVHAGSISGGLNESVWDIAAVPDLVRPLIHDHFAAPEAESLMAETERHTVSHMLHKAARERRNTALRQEVTEWCRRRLSLHGAVTLFRAGHRKEAASWALALASMRLHRRAYQLYDAKKAKNAG